MNNKKNEQRIDVCYESSVEYAMITAASIISIFENTKYPVTIHICHDNAMTNADFDKFQEIAKQYSQRIMFHNTEKLIPNRKKIFDKYKDDVYRCNFIVIDRLFIMNYLPKSIKKLIHLGGDTIITCDIKDLYDEELGKNGFASVPEIEATFNHMVAKEIIKDGTVKEQNYFCEDVFLVDMEKYREYPNLCIDGFEWLKKNPQYDCISQDIQNYYFSDDYRKLPVKYDMFVGALRNPEVKKNHTQIKKGIYHYAGNAFRAFSTDDMYTKLFLKYFIKTPWFNVDIFANFIKESTQIRQSMDIDYLNFSTNRKVVFCGDISKDVVTLQRKGLLETSATIFFNIYNTHGECDINSLIKYIRGHINEGYFFYILGNRCEYICFSLKQEGFIENVHFQEGNHLLKSNDFPPNYKVEALYNKRGLSE